MMRRKLRSLGRLLGLAGVAALLSTQAGDAKSCDNPPTGEAPVVQVRLDEWRSDLPPGVSLILPGGSFVNNSFPALSADGSKIAIFYHAPHPMQDAYPTVDIYSTATLSLQKRIKFVPERERRHALDLSDPEVVAHVQRRVQEVNRYLADGGFQSIPQWFSHGGYSPQPSEPPADKLGRRVILGTTEEPDVVKINSLADGTTELRIELPHFLLEAENPQNSCSGYGLPEEGWYSQEARIFVLRVTFLSTRDGCEQPEQWLLRRL